MNKFPVVSLPEIELFLYTQGLPVLWCVGINPPFGDFIPRDPSRPNRFCIESFIRTDRTALHNDRRPIDRYRFKNIPVVGPPYKKVRPGLPASGFSFEDIVRAIDERMGIGHQRQKSGKVMPVDAIVEPQCYGFRIRLFFHSTRSVILRSPYRYRRSRYRASAEIQHGPVVPFAGKRSLPG